MPTPWTEHVRAYAYVHQLPYRVALKEAKASYVPVAAARRLAAKKPARKPVTRRREATPCARPKAHQDGDGLLSKGIAAAGGLVARKVSLSDYEQLMADLAAIAYKPEKDRPRSYKGLTYVPEQSNAYRAVYRNAAGFIVAAFRGTAADVRDLVSDAAIVAGSRAVGWNERFAAELAWAQAIQPAAVTGHSLGGAIALYVGEKMGPPVQVYSWNPGAGPTTRWRGADANRVHVYKILGDPVSNLSSLPGTKTFSADGRWNPHTMKQFTGL